MSKEATKQEIRETILDAAERLLTRYGYGKMTMSDLAAEAGIGVGTTYLHFPSKAEVAVGVIKRFNVRVVEEQRRLAASAAPAAERLRDVLTQGILIRFERIRQERHGLDELRTAIRQQDGLREQAAHWRGLEMRLVAGLLTEGHAAGEFDFEDATVTAEAMLWATEAFLPRNLRQEDLGTPHLVPGRVHGVVDLLLRAVKRQGFGP